MENETIKDYKQMVARGELIPWKGFLNLVPGDVIKLNVYSGDVKVGYRTMEVKSTSSEGEDSPDGTAVRGYACGIFTEFDNNDEEYATYSIQEMISFNDEYEAADDTPCGVTDELDELLELSSKEDIEAEENEQYERVIKEMFTGTTHFGGGSHRCLHYIGRMIKDGYIRPSELLDFVGTMLEDQLRWTGNKNYQL